MRTISEKKIKEAEYFLETRLQITRRGLHTPSDKAYLNGAVAVLLALGFDVSGKYDMEMLKYKITIGGNEK